MISRFSGKLVLVLAVIDALGLDVEVSARALSAFHEPEGRGAVVAIPTPGNGTAWLIDDSYNASPASMAAAFSKTSMVWQGKGKKGRKIAIIGDMLELGEKSEQLHVGLAPILQSEAFDQVWTAGAYMRALHDALPSHMQGEHANDAKSLLPILRHALKNEDVILVKGSHGSKMYMIAQALKEEQHAV